MRIVASMLLLTLGISGISACARGSGQRPVRQHAAAAPVARSSPDGVPSLPCELKRDDGAVAITPARAMQRRGQRDLHFSDRETSAAAPIELCGFARELNWLVAQRCADGSRPWGENKRAAHAARKHAVVTATQCEMPVDVYEAKCPEKTYQVHISVYVCTADEGVYDNWSNPRSDSSAAWNWANRNPRLPR